MRRNGFYYVRAHFFRKQSAMSIAKAFANEYDFYSVLNTGKTSNNCLTADSAVKTVSAEAVKALKTKDIKKCIKIAPERFLLRSGAFFPKTVGDVNSQGFRQRV